MTGLVAHIGVYIWSLPEILLVCCASRLAWQWLPSQLRVLYNFLLTKAILSGLRALLLTRIFQGLGHISAEFSSSFNFHNTQIATDAAGVL